MANWLSTIFEPLKAAADTAKGLIEIRDTVKFGDAIIKLQAEIMAVYEGATAIQARETAMAEEIGHLKGRLAEFESWETEKQRYHLHQLPPGIFVYSLNEESMAGEPFHHICQTCYQRGKKSVLHQSEVSSGIYHLKCYECGSDLKAGYWNSPAVHYNSPRGGGGSWMGN